MGFDFGSAFNAINPVSAIADAVTGGLSNTAINIAAPFGAAALGASAFGGAASATDAAAATAAGSEGFSLAGAAKDFGPSLLMGGMGYLGQQSANEANQASAREQMAFQERMSNTSHQREVKDLMAAGLNPILSAHGGASSPVGASSVAGNAAGAGITSAIQTQSAKTALDALNNQVKKTNFDMDQDQKLNFETIRNARAQKNLIDAQAASAANSARSAKAQAEIDEQKAEMYKKNPNLMMIEKTAEIGGKVMGAANSAASIHNSYRTENTDSTHYDMNGQIKGGTQTTRKRGK